MKTHRPTMMSLNMTPAKSLALVLITFAGVCTMMMTSLHTWTPGIELLIETPDGYQSARDFRTARKHDFPTLRDQPPPAPVAGAGHLLEVYDGKPYGTSEAPRTSRPGTNRNRPQEEPMSEYPNRTPYARLPALAREVLWGLSFGIAVHGAVIFLDWIFGRAPMR